jgi:hypothetical protein
MLTEDGYAECVGAYRDGQTGDGVGRRRWSGAIGAARRGANRLGRLAGVGSTEMVPSAGPVDDQ